MKTVDFSYVILTYNFLIGALLIVASEKLGLITSGVLRVKRQKVARVTRLAFTTFGSCLVAITLTVLILSRFAN
ncbi:MAG: hypothetical protein LC747_05050 [Acidobacteria bacterium]|nr:hypothetical protein [Acidobacteriota bacterium]